MGLMLKVLIFGFIVGDKIFRLMVIREERYLLNFY